MHHPRAALAALALCLLPTLAPAEPGVPEPLPAAIAPMETAPRASLDSADFRTPQTVERIRARLDASPLPLWTKYDVRLDGRSIDVLVWMPHQADYDKRTATEQTCRAVFDAVAYATTEDWARRNATPSGRRRWHTYVLAGERSGMCDYS